ncbi:hypothetical protein [Marinobacter sp. MMG032]|uniref:Uncharacterized protein n=1 Tax=Marinobacter sp. MMG032 TaxID=3158548 RepID=A0AAU7MMD7_9GAMM
MDLNLLSYRAISGLPKALPAIPIAFILSDIFTLSLKKSFLACLFFEQKQRERLFIDQMALLLLLRDKSAFKSKALEK